MATGLTLRPGPSGVDFEAFGADSAAAAAAAADALRAAGAAPRAVAAAGAAASVGTALNACFEEVRVVPYCCWTLFCLVRDTHCRGYLSPTWCLPGSTWRRQ